MITIVEIYRRLTMAFNGARCRWAAYVRARSALIIGARGHAKARRHGGDEPSAFRTPGCRSSAAVRSCADPPERAGRRGLLDAGGGGKPAISACGIAKRRKSYCRLDRSRLSDAGTIRRSVHEVADLDPWAEAIREDGHIGELQARLLGLRPTLD